MLPAPPKSSKRRSAPHKTLNQDLTLVNRQKQAQNEDLLDLLFGNDSANANNMAQKTDVFDIFDDSSSKANHQNHLQNHLQIHPNLINPRESRSLQPDQLFVPSMWNVHGKNDNSSFQENKPSANLDYGNKLPRIKENKTEDKDKEEEKQKKKKHSDDQNNDNQAPETETNALEELHRGAALLKYPRRSGFPHFKHIQLSPDNLRIQWYSKRKSLLETCIWIKDIRDVVRGQETEVFKKFHQKTLEKSSFSVVYGHSYKTLDVAAKSIDECEMWVRSILKLTDVYKINKHESDLRTLKDVFVGIIFKDRNRPMSRAGSGHFIRANSSKKLKIDPVALKEIERDMENLHKTYHKTYQLSTKKQIVKSTEYSNIQYILSELEERIEELTYEVANIRDTELAKREVWRANVDLSTIMEKVEVLIKHSSNSRRKSNFL